MLIISDSTDDDPVGLRTSPVPRLHLPSPLFGAEEYLRAPLVLLDDRSYTGFTLRHVPHRRGLIVVLVDPDDGTIYPRAAAIGAEAVIRAGDNLNWLHLRLHDATVCPAATPTGKRSWPAVPPTLPHRPAADIRQHEPPWHAPAIRRSSPCTRYPNAVPTGRWRAGWWCRT